MDFETYRTIAYLMIDLVSCAVNGTTPDSEKIRDIDLALLFEVCEQHVLTAVTAYALESAGIKEHAFTQAKEKAIRKNILLDAERTKIMKRFEAEHIWYLPLKGAILKDWYPKLGMRQMSDNDILCDPNARDTVKEIMLAENFILKERLDNVDEYYKQPVHNFEMHSGLFTEYRCQDIQQYYRTVKERLIQDADHDFGYHFTNEDFYVYMIAHEFKHYTDGGTGVRSLLDTYIFMRKFGDQLDMHYIEKEIEALNLTAFEQRSRNLACKLFRCEVPEDLTDSEKLLLDYYIFSGAYGTVENSGKNLVENGMHGTGKAAKLHYVFQRLFPPMSAIKVGFPFFYKHKWLIPVLWIIRPFRGLILNRKRMLTEIKQLFSHD